MKLSDVMSAAGLAGYAEVGLVLFFGAFVAVALRLYLSETHAELEALAKIPLDGGDEDGGAA